MNSPAGVTQLVPGEQGFELGSVRLPSQSLHSSAPKEGRASLCGICVCVGICVSVCPQHWASGPQFLVVTLVYSRYSINAC